MKNTVENRLKQRQYCIDYYNLTMTEHPEIDALIGRGVSPTNEKNGKGWFLAEWRGEIPGNAAAEVTSPPQIKK